MTPADRNIALSRASEGAIGQDATPFQQMMARHGLYAPWSGVGAGWVPLVDRLVIDLKAAGWVGDIAQIKEKWGQLTIYLSTTYRPPPPFCDRCRRRAAGDRWARARLCPPCTTIRDEHLRVERVRADRYQAMVRAAEEASLRVCEDCGAPGRRNTTGYLVTLCERCRAAQQGRPPMTWADLEDQLDAVGRAVAAIEADDDPE